MEEIRKSVRTAVLDWNPGESQQAHRRGFGVDVLEGCAELLICRSEASLTFVFLALVLATVLTDSPKIFGEGVADTYLIVGLGGIWSSRGALTFSL